MSGSSLRLLLIEDQIAIAKNIVAFLEKQQHTLDYASDGVQGLELALNNYYDVVILDLMLPGIDGWNVCQKIRERSARQVPIIMLTARDSVDDKVKGFDLGADDYLTKPFALEELNVRCIALSRRNQLNTEYEVRIGTLIIDRKLQTVSREGQPVELHQIPFKILLTLAESYPRVVSRSELCSKIWGEDLTESDSLRSHIYQLRKQIDKPYSIAMIKTVHGVGFSLESDE